MKKTIKIPNAAAKSLSDPKFRQQAVPSKKDSLKKDSWSRQAKHKGKKIEEAFVFESFQVGDAVKVSDSELQEILDRADDITAKQIKKDVEEKDPVVIDPAAPAGNVKINIGGEAYLVDKEEISLIMENLTENEYDDILEWSMADTTSGIPIYINREELEVMGAIKGKTYTKVFSERENEVARKMVSKGMLRRYKDENGIYVVINNDDLRRI